MNFADIQILLVQYLPVLITLFMPLIVQLAKQPRFNNQTFLGIEVNTIIAYAAAIVFSALGLWASGKPLDPTFITAMVGGATALYNLYFKNTKLAKSLGEFGLKQGPQQTDNSARDFDGPQDVSQDPNADYTVQ